MQMMMMPKGLIKTLMLIGLTSVLIYLFTEDLNYILILIIGGAIGFITPNEKIN